MRKALSLGAAPSARGGSEGTVAPAKLRLRGVKWRPVLSSCVWLSRGSNRVLRPWSPWSPTHPTAVREMLTDITGGTQWRTRADGVVGGGCPDSPWGVQWERSHWNSSSGEGVTGWDWSSERTSQEWGHLQKGLSEEEATQEKSRQVLGF